MLEQILKLYVMAMNGDVRSPMPHLVGPPGCGKSTIVELAAKLLGVNLHVVNVSRWSPLEIEGVQMPVDMDTDERRLHMLHSTVWTSLKEGDILLFDELLRAFPEVFNGLLDIFTSRSVAGFELPPVFIIGASNSVVTYDKALEDRLLHITVPDVRRNKGAQKQQAELLVSALGLHPDMANSLEMQSLIDTEIKPMYALLDQFTGKGQSGSTALEGRSMRNLIGQAKLREVNSQALRDLLNVNNRLATGQGKYQHLFLFDKKNPELLDSRTKAKLQMLEGNERLSPIQALNVKLNLELIGLEEKRKEKGTTDDDDVNEHV